MKISNFSKRGTRGRYEAHQGAVIGTHLGVHINFHNDDKETVVHLDLTPREAKNLMTYLTLGLDSYHKTLAAVDEQMKKVDTK